jgi:hypothetical protein
MSELNRFMVTNWACLTDPDGPHKEHIPSTVFEEHQLCLAWLRENDRLIPLKPPASPTPPAIAPAVVNYGEWLTEMSDDDWKIVFAYHPDLKRRLQTVLSASPALPTVGEIPRLVEALRFAEKHCPCGARPESLSTHPHTPGCLIGSALERLDSAALTQFDGWNKWVNCGYCQGRGYALFTVGGVRQACKPCQGSGGWITVAPANAKAGDACPCKLSTCVEPWEPGCGLGTTKEHAQVVPGTLPVGRELLQRIRGRAMQQITDPDAAIDRCKRIVELCDAGLAAPAQVSDEMVSVARVREIVERARREFKRGATCDYILAAISPSQDGMVNGS